MERTHVAIVDLPPLQAELVGDWLGRQADFEVKEPDSGPLASAGGTLEGIDVLITGSERTSAGVVAELLERHPRLRILSIRPDGRGSVLARLVPELAVLGDTSPHDLVALLPRASAPWEELVAAQLPQDGCWGSST
jgi:hypothetical protein